MKKLKIFLMFVIVGSLISINAMSMQPRHSGHDGNGQDHQRPNSVGAPLDGGLLAILGAAGIAYFVAKKKKNSIEE